MGTAALVVGVVALVLAVLLIFFPIAFVLGILAAIFGFVGIRRADRGQANNRGHALAGLVCGALAFVLAISIAIRLGTFINDHTGDFRDFWTCITSAPTESEQQACGETLARQLDE
jgi:O-antigen/teichoic acid export membrane protein